MLTHGTNASGNHRGNLFGKVAGFFASRSAGRPTVHQTIEAEPQPAITVSHVQGRVPVSILQLRGTINSRNYRDLIAKAKEIYRAGGRRLVLDMSEISAVGISSHLALHSIAVLLQGKEPLDPEAGWDALHAIARDLKAGVTQEHFKLFNPKPAVRESLEQAGFTGFLEIHTDLETAIASF